MRGSTRGLVVSLLGTVLVVTAQAPTVSAPRGDTVSGTLVATVADDFAAGEDTDGLGIIPDEDPTRFVPLAGVEAADLAVAPGERVRARGRLAAGGLRTAASGVRPLTARSAPSEGSTPLVAPFEEPEVAAAARTTSLLAITVRFSDGSGGTVDKARLSRTLFGDGDSVSTYYSETSRGSWTTKGRVVGPFTVSGSTRGCDWEGWGDSARDQAGRTVDLSAYTNVMVVWPTAACGWAGLGHVRGPYSWINQSTPSVLVTAHELGHNYGLPHASSYECRDASGRRVTISDRCSVVGYADPFSAMGNRGARLHHGIHRQDLRLMSTRNVAYDEATEVDLAPLYAAGGVRALRIPRDGRSSYVVEYRRPYATFDDFASASAVATGVTIRVDQGGDDSLLLDTTPDTRSLDDAALQVGRVFEDPTTGMRLTLEARTSSLASVSVSWPSTRTPPAWLEGAGRSRANVPVWRPPADLLRP
ncbi:hypothetical protein KC207_11980 [Phycicoccus sp. BSK3Z-2]|uniref:Peptidase M11 gametolysin domain-containing protein n=1 Tax=Phycicoccus avicenniae TaxID=2828860 RepID=A0A941D8G2_9MICO|nr:hypothetical protein [Phycicoccus avicenniae]MBR7744009.1 hypothetical protein [Phycicoccus avicenniae]